MYTFLCGLCGNVVRFFILLYFFSQLSDKTFRLGFALIWMLPWVILNEILPSQLLTFLIGFLFLFLYGIFNSKIIWKHAVLISVLLLSIDFWSDGVAETIGYWLAKEVGSKYIGILQFLDFGMVVFSCGLLYFSLLGVSKLFRPNLQYLYHQILLIVICPFLFILLSERVITTTVYGDTIIWSYTGGFIYPQIQTVPILILQILAGMTFLSILLLLCRLEKTISMEEENKLLMHQLVEQTRYMQERQSYEQQLCSLQHDMKNHFLLLQELLSRQKIEEATSYLADLEQLSHQIDYPVRTGNATVDILLKSKLSIVAQKGVEIECNLKIPAISPIADMEWCIIFGNAVDNASQAVEAIPEDERYLHINGTQKGSFLYLRIENSCSVSLSSIIEGVGLSNLRTVVKNHSGTLDIEIDAGKFSLDILLLISQQ